MFVVCVCAKHGTPQGGLAEDLDFVETFALLFPILDVCAENL